MDGTSEVSLPAHTISLRRALRDCSDGIERLRRAQDAGIVFTFMEDAKLREVIQHAWALASKHEDLRRDGIAHVRRRLDIAAHDDSDHIDVINVVNSNAYQVEGSEGTMSADEFKQKFSVRNIPCIIRGLRATDFASVSSKWADESNTIVVDWFREHIGDETKVPVRVDTTRHSGNNALDVDGRAAECETANIKLCEWIEYCEQSKQPIPQESDYLQIGSSGYLKDWHLQQFLANKNSTQLYSVPSIFDKDILNNFLTRYIGGDYKFVYWGPAHSRTTLHSDVLHSFSWSYNVVGRKLWTFYVPDSSDEEQTPTPESFQIIQEAGETIFVPAKWKHEVVNLVETLSINHNWVTSANVDCTYECMSTEITSIEKEIRKWNIISEDDYEARENMLRGCVGLDVSMFVMMSLLEMIELLGDLLCRRDADEDFIINILYSAFRFHHVLRDLFSKSSERVQPMKRLTAILNSEELASEVMACSQFCIRLCEVLIKTTYERRL